jgi:putative glycosyltransferase (TIGR04348 family)
MTALRWQAILRRAGHQVKLSMQLPPRRARCDMLIALHARKSFAAIARFKATCPQRPLVVALTGTDVYEDLPQGNPEVQSALYFADRLVALQPLVRTVLPERYRSKTRVIYQSAVARVRYALSGKLNRLLARWMGADWERSAFVVCVLAHLRDVKDPLLAAQAARLAPAESRIQVLQVGRATTPAWKMAAQAEARTNPRYHWLGEVSHGTALQLMLRSRLLCATSRQEGGANVLMEAIAQQIPVLATRIDGAVGILGPQYAGYFPSGDARELARVLWRCEKDARFYQLLRRQVRALGELADPAREAAAWRSLLAEL